MTIKVEQPFLQLLLDRSPQHSPLQDSCCCNESDDYSVSTSSTFPFSDTSISDDDVVRRVSFADELVSEVVTRPRTPLQDISQLYYSTEDIASFRQDYRLERKLLSELSLDYSTANEEQLERLTAGWSPSSKHFIHRVVVVSHNGVETFSQNLLNKPLLLAKLMIKPSSITIRFGVVQSRGISVLEPTVYPAYAYIHCTCFIRLHILGVGYIWVAGA